MAIANRSAGAQEVSLRHMMFHWVPASLASSSAFAGAPFGNREDFWNQDDVSADAIQPPRTRPVQASGKSPRLRHPWWDLLAGIISARRVAGWRVRIDLVGPLEFSAQLAAGGSDAYRRSPPTRGAVGCRPYDRRPKKEPLILRGRVVVNSVSTVEPVGAPTGCCWKSRSRFTNSASRWDL